MAGAAFAIAPAHAENRVALVIGNSTSARWTELGSLAVIFESPERADPLIEEDSKTSPSKKAARRSPLECYFMRKHHAEPTLKVADFEMHAVGRQARELVSEPRNTQKSDCVFA
jgi:hypothetical protein